MKELAMAFRKVRLGHSPAWGAPEPRVAELMVLHAREEHEYPVTKATYAELRRVRLQQIQAFADALGYTAFDAEDERQGRTPHVHADWPPAMRYARDTGRVSKADAERLYDAMRGGFPWMIGNALPVGMAPARTTQGYIVEMPSADPADEERHAAALACVLDVLHPGEFDIVMAADWARQSCAPWQTPWLMLAVVPAGYTLPINETELETTDAD